MPPTPIKMFRSSSLALLVTVLSAAVLLTACGGESAEPTTSTARQESAPTLMNEISFEAQLLPLLNRNCAVCHMGEGAQGDFSLYPEPYRALVAAKSKQSDLPLVTPGSVESSYLYHKLMGTHREAGGSGALMPFQRDALSEQQLNAVSQWIAAGAKNN